MSQHLNTIKAVTFTHLSSLKMQEVINDENKAISNYADIFRSYFDCHEEISRCFFYVDVCFKEVIQNTILKASLKQDRNFKFEIEADLLNEEEKIKNILNAAKDTVQSRVPQEIPFVFIGLTELLQVVNNIVKVDKTLLKKLRGKDNKFTYDSPKFVESVIRIARGTVPHLGLCPIVRFDEDVQPNPKGLREIISTYKSQCLRKTMYFFSGSYGHVSDPDFWNPLNNHAVRTHWFYDVDTPVDENGIPDVHRDKISELKKKTTHFLSDFESIGAVQLNKDVQFSQAAGLPAIVRRKSTQVISGAGLVMSTKAIRFLPPFMNFNTLTTWTDDFLKRLLHEMVGDVKPADEENKLSAKFIQLRHVKKGKITQEDIDKAELYFERVLRGCLMKSCIQNDDDGTPTLFSNCIRDIVYYNKYSTTRERLRQYLLSVMESKYDKVLRCWSSNEFSRSLSYDWAKSRLVDKMDCSKKKSEKDTVRKKIIRSLTSDLLEYIDLVKVWPIFVRAIDRLDILGNRWLFSYTN